MRDLYERSIANPDSVPDPSDITSMMGV